MTQASDRIGLKLTDFSDMEDIVDVILADNATATADLKNGGYWEVDADGELVVDLAHISKSLGRPFDEKDFLVYVSSFYGRVSVDDERIRLSSDILLVEDYESATG